MECPKDRLNDGITQQNFDTCQYFVETYQSVAPVGFQLWENKFISLQNNIEHRDYNYRSVIDMESELRGITRPLSNCPSMKYTPGCKLTSANTNCMGTFSKPPVFNPYITPPVHNNLVPETSKGFVIPKQRCGMKLIKQYNYEEEKPPYV